MLLNFNNLLQHNEDWVRLWQGSNLLVYSVTEGGCHWRQVQFLIQNLMGVIILIKT